MSESRLKWLERECNREDLPEDLAEAYEREANEIQDKINKRNDLQKFIREQRLKDMMAEKELEKVMTLTEEMVDKMYMDCCLKYQDVNGVSFESWFNQSMKYYSVDEKNNVHAKARSADTVEIIEHPTLAQAKLTIFKRIRWKFYDHAVRGSDFAYDIN